jgi:7-cyano-7-deazaguanine synthase
MRKKSVILLSGGFDSAANLALCHEKDEPVLAITARYGQRAEKAEILASQRLCTYYQVPHLVVDLSWLGQISNSSLTQKSKDVPQLEINQLDDSLVTNETAKAVWVPNRNGLLIHVAAAYAESQGAEQVLCGFNSEEAATFPDNSVEYLNRVTSALAFSTATQVRVSSYTAEWNKRQIFLELQKLVKRFPLEWVWSCYEGASEPCGKCESCRRLVRATENLLQN